MDEWLTSCGDSFVSQQIKQLERKVRTLEVHKDRVSESLSLCLSLSLSLTHTHTHTHRNRHIICIITCKYCFIIILFSLSFSQIEEMRDEYLLKLKLREGAFNLAQALASQSSKASKEKLQEARAEQKELLEDLCDIEDELETKLGVFKVHINGTKADVVSTYAVPPLVFKARQLSGLGTRQVLGGDSPVLGPGLINNCGIVNFLRFCMYDWWLVMVVTQVLWAWSRLAVQT